MELPYAATLEALLAISSDTRNIPQRRNNVNISDIKWSHSGTVI
jgi:hypothetical protein